MHPEERHRGVAIKAGPFLIVFLNSVTYNQVGSNSIAIYLHTHINLRVLFSKEKSSGKFDLKPMKVLPLRIPKWVISK